MIKEAVIRHLKGLGFGRLAPKPLRNILRMNKWRVHVLGNRVLVRDIRWWGRSIPVFFSDPDLFVKIDEVLG